MVDRRRVAQGYDDLSDVHDEWRPKTDAPVLPHLEDLTSTLDADDLVLDAGCGAGDPVARVLSERVRVLGLDASRRQLALARERAPAATLTRGDLVELPFRDDAVDGLCCLYAVIHVPWDDHARCFRELHRVCRDGAPGLITVGDSDWRGEHEGWLDSGTAMAWDVPGPQRARRLLGDAGFDVTAEHRFSDPVSEADDGDAVLLRVRA